MTLQAINHLMFPTLVSLFKCDRHQEFKSVALDRLPAHCAIHENGGLFSGEASGHVDVHTDPALEGLFRFVTEGVAAYLDQLSFDRSRVDINIVKTWVSVTDANTVTPAHLHATSHLSFVYYLQMPQNADNIAFRIQSSPNEPYSGAFDVGTPRQRPMVREHNALNSNQCSMGTSEGDLLVFPSHVFHGTHKVGDMGSDQRISIAGDVLLVFNEERPNYATGLFSPSIWRCFPTSSSEGS